jgi:hypothetical protein
MTPFILRKYAETIKPDKVEETFRRRIENLLNLEPNFGFKQYEEFHARWECIQRLIASDNISISSLYKLDTQTPIRAFSPSVKSFLQLPHLFSNSDEVKSESTLLENVIMPAESNPGFDIVTMENTVDEKQIAIAIECRFSQPGSTTQLTLGEIQEKRELTLREFEKIKGKGHFIVCFLFFNIYLIFCFSEGPVANLKEEDIYLIVCAFRNLQNGVLPHSIEYPKGESKEESKPKPLRNTIILGKERLSKIYGPTLANRPQFLLSGLGKRTQKVLRFETKCDV